MNKRKKRVFIVDYDLIGPLGIGRSQTLYSLEQNVCAESSICNFNPKGLPITAAAEVKTELKYLYSKELLSVLSAIKYDRKFELLVATYYLMEERLKWRIRWKLIRCTY